MDPDRILDAIRESVATIRETVGQSGIVHTPDADRLAEQFDDLDAWLNKGGFLPTDWSALHRCGI